jgi:hypothetical protein
MKTTMTKSKKYLLGGLLAVATPFALPNAIRAADHGDGPTASNDQACDIADVFFFADPTVTDNLVIIGTFRGFIVPAEAGNFAIFDPNVRYRFQVENTGNASPDKFIDVTFSPKTSAAEAQTATIKITGLGKFTANATLATSEGSAAPEITTSEDGVKFFAGEVDDPFFFDIPAFNRVVKSILDGSPNTSFFSRARDSFAGYNILSIALSVPKTLLLKEGGTVLGLNFMTQRHTVETPGSNGEVKAQGAFRNIDRMGIPAVNVALVPFNKKNKYNAASTQDDKAGKFLGDIGGTLGALLDGLGIQDPQKSATIGTFKSVAIDSGDFLRLDTTLPSGFPNGRRLADDTIDTILSILVGGTLGDGVNGNDVPLRNEFPFLAAPQLPLANGVIDDNTRN